MADLSEPTRKEMSWPAAATLIAAIIGAAATSVALAISPDINDESSGRFATHREIGEVKVRLGALEETSQRMRIEIREDIKDLRLMVQSLMREQVEAKDELNRIVTAPSDDSMTQDMSEKDT